MKTMTKNKIGQAFVSACKKLGGFQESILHKIADRATGTVYSRHDEHWKFVNRWKFLGGHIPGTGGRFWSGSLRLFGWRLQYQEGWGDPGTWKFYKIPRA